MLSLLTVPSPPFRCDGLAHCIPDNADQRVQTARDETTQTIWGLIQKGIRGSGLPPQIEIWLLSHMITFLMVIYRTILLSRR